MKIWKTLFFPKNELNGTIYFLKIALITLVRMRPRIFVGTRCNACKRHDKREPSLFKKEFRCSEMLCLCSKTYCCYDKQANKSKFSSKGLNKRTLEDCGAGGPMSKYRIVIEETVNVTSTKRGFQTIQHSIQRKDCLTFFQRE